MGFRFGKSIRLGKHFRVNVSRRGIGASVGVKGLRVGTGPRGSRITASVPGTGVSYSGGLAGGRGKRVTQSAVPQSVSKIPSPGFFASKQEKEFVGGLNAYLQGQESKAVSHFLSIASKEAGAALLAALMMAKTARQEQKAIKLLEKIVSEDAEFPTPLMEKYISTAQVRVNITENVAATVPMDGLLATLVLVELYQEQSRFDDAIGLLEEVDDLADEPAITLSLCELYIERQFWDGIIERAQGTESEDDITLETLIYYGRALQAKGLHDAATAVFTKALKRVKGRNPHLLRQAKYSAGISFQALNQRTKSNKLFQELFAEDPTFRDVKQRLGMV